LWVAGVREIAIRIYVGDDLLKQQGGGEKGIHCKEGKRSSGKEKAEEKCNNERGAVSAFAASRVCCGGEVHLLGSAARGEKKGCSSLKTTAPEFKKKIKSDHYLGRSCFRQNKKGAKRLSSTWKYGSLRKAYKEGSRSSAARPKGGVWSIIKKNTVPLDFCPTMEIKKRKLDGEKKDWVVQTATA